MTRVDVRDGLWDDTRGDAAGGDLRGDFRGDTRGETGRGVTRGDTEGDLCDFLGLFDGTLFKVTEDGVVEVVVAVPEAFLFLEAEIETD